MSNELIEALYIPETRLPGEPSYYADLLDDEDFASIAPQVFHLLKQQGRLSEIPEFFKAYLKNQFLQSMQLNLFVKHQTNLILHSFEEHGIEVIPLKGVCFAESYYGNLGARRTTDIDLLIKPPALEEAINIAKKLGFTVEEEIIPGHFHCGYSKRLPGSEIPLVVELHWDLVKESTANFDINDFWQSARPYEHANFIKELSGFHVFYMMILHGWRHNLHSMKYYLDIIHLIHYLKNEFDFARLIEIAENHKTRRRIVRTLTAVYQEFPFTDKIKAFSYKTGKHYLNLGAKKNGSSFYRKYTDYIDYQYFSYDSAGHICKEVIDTILSARK